MKAQSLEVAIQRVSRAAHIPPDRRLREWALAALGRKASVTLRYVGEAQARSLNREFRGKDYATNVLTFIYESAPRRLLEGDIVVCAPVVLREARAQGKSPLAHHAHLLVHGLLHLQGFDHEDDRQAARMERQERIVLRRLGFADPYGDAW